MGPVFISIVNYRTGRLAVDCLASLAGNLAELRGGRVIVVDNASGDDSVQVIADAIAARGWSGWAELLPLPRNGGFAYGNNAAIGRVREIDAAFGTVVLLNPDATVEHGAIDALADHLERQPRAGIAGALIETEHGEATVSAHTRPSPLGELEGSARLGMLSRWLAPYAVSRPTRADVHRCDWVSGACMAIRREVLDAIGPMDEGYFLYFEEVDFCVRAIAAGWECWFVPAARVMHLEGAATGIRETRRRRPSYWYASRRRFFAKAYGVPGLLAADVLWALGRLSFVTRRALGLGGRASGADDPLRFSHDLLIGDLKALAGGELRSVPRHG